MHEYTPTHTFVNHCTGKLGHYHCCEILPPCLGDLFPKIKLMISNSSELDNWNNGLLLPAEKTKALASQTKKENSLIYLNVVGKKGNEAELVSNKQHSVISSTSNLLRAKQLKHIWQKKQREQSSNRQPQNAHSQPSRELTCMLFSQTKYKNGASPCL